MVSLKTNLLVLINFFTSVVIFSYWSIMAFYFIGPMYLHSLIANPKMLSQKNIKQIILNTLTKKKLFKLFETKSQLHHNFLRSCFILTKFLFSKLFSCETLLVYDNILLLTYYIVILLIRWYLLLQKASFKCHSWQWQCWISWYQKGL